MIKTSDVGSLPFTGDFEKFKKGAQTIDPLLELLISNKMLDERKYFEKKVVQSFIDKVEAGIDVPSYPQFRDMNKMFLNSIKGIKRTKGGYEVTERITLEKSRSLIPEVHVLKERAGEIHEKTDKLLKIRISITGPYTLSSAFIHRDSELFRLLGEIIVRIIEDNYFSGKYGGVAIITIDEPVFGVLDDSQLDFGSSGREELIKAWEKIFLKVKSKDIQSCIHLHSTTNDAFWQIKSLDVVESHVDDTLYSSNWTRKLLEAEDKFLKASISITIFDVLIRKKIVEKLATTDENIVNQKIAKTWMEIRKMRINPIRFIETQETMKKRLESIIDRYGEERVPYAGPECGLRGFPTYDSAIECLRRVANATQIMNTQL